LLIYNNIQMIRIHLSRLLGEHKQRIADVQRDTGLARNTLAGLYREDVARVDLATLDALCRHFGCEISDLLEFVPDESASSRG
jgi:putative transcriptional regulator